MSQKMFDAYDLLATGAVTAILSAGVALAWDAMKRLDGRTELSAANGAWSNALEVQERNDRARWAPVYSENLFAIEADQPNDFDPVTGRLVQVVYPADDPQVAAGLDRLADEVGLVQALACCGSHDICNDGEPCDPVEHALPCCGDCPDWVHALSDRPAEDEDEVGDEQPGEAASRLLLPLLAVARWWGRVMAHVEALAEDVRDRFKSNETLAQEWIAQADDAPWVLYDEDELRAEGMSEEDIAALREGLVRIPPSSTPYRGRHWVSDVAHTGAWPVVIPAQRDGGDLDA